MEENDKIEEQDEELEQKRNLLQKIHELAKWHIEYNICRIEGMGIFQSKWLLNDIR